MSETLEMTTFQCGNYVGMFTRRASGLLLPNTVLYGFNKQPITREPINGELLIVKAAS